MLSIYLKPTNYCNIGCSHCYLPEETRANKHVMSDETLVATMQMVKDMASREGHNAVHFIWHGGEPMVLSPSYYKRANAIMASELEGLAFTQSIQTALIPYREEWSEVIREYFGNHIGTSIDFSQRTVKDSPQAYIDLWMSKVRMARAHGHSLTAGMVPTRHEISKAGEIYQWFVDNEFDSFNVDRYSGFEVKSIDWPSNREHATFLVALFDCVIRDLKARGQAPMINTVASGILGVTMGRSADRWGTRCQKEFLVIEPNGSLNTCPDRARHETPFSNVHDGAEQFIASDARRNWIRIADITHKEHYCHSCEFSSFCRSGCPVTPNGPAHGQKECSGYKSYLLHIKQYIEDHPNDKELLLGYVQRKYVSNYQ